MVRKNRPRRIIFQPHQLVVAGERHHSDNIQWLVAQHAGRLELHCNALLKWEQENPHDPDAIAVLVDHRRVGYIAQANSARLRQLIGTAGINLDCVIHWNGETVNGIYDVKLFPPL